LGGGVYMKITSCARAPKHIHMYNCFVNQKINTKNKLTSAFNLKNHIFSTFCF
jgi:hypothetical protein